MLNYSKHIYLISLDDFLKLYKGDAEFFIEINPRFIHFCMDWRPWSQMKNPWRYYQDGGWVKTEIAKIW